MPAGRPLRTMDRQFNKKVRIGRLGLLWAAGASCMLVIPDPVTTRGVDVCLWCVALPDVPGSAGRSKESLSAILGLAGGGSVMGDKNSMRFGLGYSSAHRNSMHSVCVSAGTDLAIAYRLGCLLIHLYRVLSMQRVSAVSHLLGRRQQAG